MHLQTQHGERLELAEEINRGGEAQIWSVRRDPHVVAKIYHKAAPEREAKLQAMLANPPRQAKTHSAIAWPTDLLYQNNNLVGFLMPKVYQSASIFRYYNPTLRARSLPPYHWRHFLHRTALNLVLAVEQIHAQGHVIGDLNESNVLVNNQALVTLVDTDSFQISDSSHSLHRCLVGKAEFTPAELQGVDFKTIDRTIAHDNYSLAVMLFYLLMDGVHPFAGVLTSKESVQRVDLYCVKRGLFPYRDNRFVIPPPSAPSIDHLDPQIRKAFERGFVHGHNKPTKRPSTQEWQELLRQAETKLIACQRDKEHVYSKHLRRCPTCPPEATLQGRIEQAIVKRIPKPSTVRARLDPRAVDLRAMASWRPPAPAEIGNRLQHSARQAATHLKERSTATLHNWVSSIHMPAQIVNGWRRIEPAVSLSTKWTLAHGLGLILIYLFGLYALPIIFGLVGTPLTAASATAWTVTLCSTIFGWMQLDAIRGRLLVQRADLALWFASTSIVSIIGGLLGLALMDIVDKMLLGAFFGLVLGYVQSRIFAGCLWRARDQRLWTLVTGIGWAVIGWGWIMGDLWLPPRTFMFDVTLSGAILGASLAALAYGIFSGSLLSWMVRGPTVSFGSHQIGWTTRLHRLRRFKVDEILLDELKSKARSWLWAAVLLAVILLSARGMSIITGLEPDHPLAVAFREGRNRVDE